MKQKMKDSGVPWIGMIPSDWEVCRLKNLHTDSNVGESIDKTFCSDNPNDTLFYTAGVKPIHTTYLDFPEWKYTQKSNLLLSRNGTPYVYIPIEGAVYSDHIIRIGVDDKCSKEYVRYCLQQAIASVVVDSVSIATWSMSLWDRQKLPFPPLPTQQRIADFLERKCAEIDELAALQETMIAELKRYKQSVITEAVTGKLKIENGKVKGESGNLKVENGKVKDSGVEWIGEIPEGWSVGRIKNVASLFGRIGFRGYTSDDLNKDGIGAITLSPSNMLPMSMDYTNVTYLSWKKYEESPEIKIQNGDLLMVKTGSSYGKVSFVDNLPREATINPQILRIVPNIHSKYLGYFLQTTYFSFQVEGGVVGGTIPTISQEKINNYHVILPPLTEQRAIADYLDQKCAEIDELIAIKQQKIEALKDYKKSVIFEYVTGKREVER